MKASENPNPERAHLGSQSDIILAPHPQCPAGEGHAVHQYGTSDVSVTCFMQASVNLKTLQTKDHTTQRYELKCKHHSLRSSSRDAPVIFDTRGTIEPRSKNTLLALLGTEKQHYFRPFLQRVTAALARTDDWAPRPSQFTSPHGAGWPSLSRGKR